MLAANFAEPLTKLVLRPVRVADQVQERFLLLVERLQTALCLGAEGVAQRVGIGTVA